MSTTLSESEIEARSEDLVDWTREGDEIRKLFKFASFPGAIGFVTQVAFLAEAAGHHPDMDIRYTKIVCSLSTHDRGGITQKDLDLARAMDSVASLSESRSVSNGKEVAPTMSMRWACA